MSIVVIGINHKTAPIAVREQIFFAKELLPFYLQDLLSRQCVEEAVLLSTCNRSELYCDTDDVSAIVNWFCAQTSLSRQALASALYIYHDEKAIAHMMEVACGLDSMVLGEPQILGQMKEAFSESCAASAVGAWFHRMFQQIFTVAKAIRTTTAIGACPVSLASAAIHFAKQQVPSFSEATVALVGAGETTELLLRYLKPHLAKPVLIVNRNTDKAALLTAAFGGTVYSLDQLTIALSQADIVFSATGSATPIISKTMVAEALQQRLRPLWFMDLAVPRDIDPQVSELSKTTYCCIDDLKSIIERNRQGREHAADKAREMIAQKSRATMQELERLHQGAYTIRAYRKQIEAICRVELTKAKQQLQQGANPDDVMNAFAYAYTQKLLHTPSVQIRKASVEGRFEFLQIAKQLFAISDPEVEAI